MNDSFEGSFQETGEVMGELVAKAREARAAGASRRSFFASTAKLAGATVLGAAGVKLLQPVAAAAATSSTATTSTDTTKQILEIAATAESLATTFYYYGLNAGFLPDVNSMQNRNYFQAALAEEYQHLLILRSLGGIELANKFYFPSDMFTNETTFFTTASLLEDYFISAYIAAAMEFSGAVSSGITTANPVALGLAVQIGGIECEHRALLRVAAGLNPPNNRIIESALIASVSDAVPALSPFLTGGTFNGVDYSAFRTLPSATNVEKMASPYTIPSFPPYTIV